ncbi:MAG: hypothetical protein K6E35_06015 [Bacteroidales bacterium]|nr:hypothetical protein [Bacteroidales bacterium]
MMTNFLLYSGSVVADIFETFFQILVPIGIVVVLPIFIVSMAMRARQHEVDKKTEVMLKAVENGAQLDPAFFQQTTERKKKTVKEKLMGRLLTACITTGIGVLLAIVLIVAFIIVGDLSNNAEDFLLLIPSAILIGVGTGFFIAYFVGKRMWAQELAELGTEKPEA